MDLTCKNVRAVDKMFWNIINCVSDKSQIVTMEELRSLEKGLTFDNLIIINSNDFSTK